jgi:hypothetical protein
MNDINAEIEFITTRRGGRSMLLAGRRYHRKKFYRKGSFWLCYYNNENGCKGSVTLNDRNEIVKEKQHHSECKPNFVHNRILKELDNLKERTSTNFDSIQKQYESMVFNLENDGLHLVENMPTYEGVKTGLNNARNKVLGVKKTRFSAGSEVIIPKKFLNFLLADYDNVDENKRIILFCGQKARTSIEEGYFKHILADGTFKSCPVAFKQLYTIHGLDEETRSIKPLIFCFLPDKKVQTYETMFYVIKSQFPNWKPTKVTVDFEIAAMHALRKVYPNITIKGCFFHFNRCLFRKAKKLNISSRVKKRHVSRCAGLARLPKHFIQTGLQYIMRKSPKGEDIKKFNNYFKKQWFTKTAFSKICSCEQEEIRTTNNIEGWHSRINRFIGKKYPTMAHLLDVLIKESRSTRTFKCTNKKAKTYVEIDEEIANAIKDLKDGFMCVGHCLEIICPYAFTF